MPALRVRQGTRWVRPEFLRMKHRIVSTRVIIKAHPTHVYKFIENMENHRQIVPGASDWTGDKDSARYSVRLGLGKQRMETRISERVIGMRICEEPTGASPCPYRRWFKIQADEHTCIFEITMECDMSAMQRLLLAPVLRSQIERMIRNLKTVMEKPKEAARPAPAASAAV
jgi:hypothetical protein